MIPQPIINLAEICARKKIKNAVVSPGSRSAPLVLSFVRNPEIKTWIFSDERSAGYIACGMSACTKLPTVLICTSGTAVYNFAPAVSEAFYQQIPLVVLTADRPPEWIDQYDNQTIRQSNIYGAHVKKCYSLPVAFDHPDDVWNCERIMSEAIDLAMAGQKGPVHINVPLREPFYPDINQHVVPSDDIKIIEYHQPQVELLPETIHELRNEWMKYSRRLAVAGFYDYSSQIHGILEKLHEKGLPIVSDITSNIQQSSFAIRRHDIFLNLHNKNLPELWPDLLITWGKTILSKNLKTYLRKYKPTVHWHVQKGGMAADTFQSITRVINMEPASFLKQIESFPGNPTYSLFWKKEEEKGDAIYRNFMTRSEFGEFKTVDMVMNNLRDDCHVHLANSMSVRYANLAGLPRDLKNIEIFSNRGVSGIDGCSSFAVGTALVSGKKTILITGDLAFFYDRNAFWHNYSLDNLRIILLNNHGGVIFRIIDGPNRQPELEEYFETKQLLNAQNTAIDFGFEHITVKSELQLQQQLEVLFSEDGKSIILEIETQTINTKEIFDQFNNYINKEYET